MNAVRLRAVHRANPAKHSDRESSRWRGTALCLLLLVGSSCGGGAGTPAAPGGPAQPPVVPTPPPPPPLPPEIGTPCPGVVVPGRSTEGAGIRHPSDAAHRLGAAVRRRLRLGGAVLRRRGRSGGPQPNPATRSQLGGVASRDDRRRNPPHVGDRMAAFSGRSNCLPAQMSGPVSFRRSCAWRSGAS